MRITLTHDHVKAMVKGFNKVIPRNGSLPVLHYILVRQDAGIDATITATNLDETLQYHVPDAVQETDEPSSFLVAFDALKKLAKQVKKGDTVMLQPGTAAKFPTVTIAASIGGQTTHSEIASMPVSEFPETLKTIPVESYPVGQFLDVYQKAITFASTDDTRYVLNGVFRHAEQHAFAATDGKRLGMFIVPDLPDDSDFILPPSKLLANGVLSAETGATGIIEEDDRQTVEILSGQWRYQCRCIEGLYPNYRQVIPAADANWAGSVTFAEADIPLLKTAVTQLAGPNDSQVFVYGDSDRVMILSGQSGENSARAHVVLPSSTCESDEPVVQSINGAYLLEGLNAGCNVCSVPSDISPWRCTGNTDGLHVVMPLRIDARDKQAVIEFVSGNVATPPEGEETVSDQQKTADNGTGEQQQAGTGDGPQHKPDLTLVDNDPVQELVDTVTAAQEAVKEANSALHGIKGKLRAVEKHYRARDRQFAKSEKVLAQLQEVVNF